MAGPVAREPRRDRWARASDGVEQGLAVFLLVWTGAFVLADPGLRPGAANGPVVSGCVLVAGLLVTGGLVATLGPRGWLSWSAPSSLAASVLLAGAGITSLVTMSADEVPASPPGVSYLTIAGAAAGLRLGTRLAAVVVSVEVLAMVGVILLRVAGGGLPYSAIDAPLFGLYVLVLAVICGVYAAVLRRTASAADEAGRLLAAAQAQRAADTAVRRDVAVHERALHDTVLNTLGAVAAGDVDGRSRTAREWFARAAEQADSLAHGAAPPAPPGSSAGSLWVRARARVPGLQPSIVGVDLDLSGLAPEVGDALVTATGEALRNVTRHSGAGTVEIVGRRTAGGGVQVAVVDAGPGFDPAATPARLGLSRSVLGAMRSVDGTATWQSAPGAGTTVTLSWAPPTPALAQHLVDDVGAALSRVAPAILVPSAALAAVSLVAGRGDYDRIGLALTAFAVLLAVSGLEVVAGRRGRLGWPVALAAFVATPVVYGLEQHALAGEPGQWSSWSSEAMLSTLIVVVIVAGPRLAWIGALVTWWVTQGLDPLEIVRPGGAMLVSAAIMAWAVRAGARSYEWSLAEVARIDGEATAAREAERRRRQRYAVLAETTVPLLRDLADGQADPADPAVRERCAEEERYVRTLVRLDPDAGPLPALLVDLARLAHARGLALDVELRDDLVGTPAAVDVETVGSGLRDVLAGLPPGSAARLTGGAEDGGVVLRLVAAMPHGTEAPRPPGLAFFADDGTGLWEAVLAAPVRQAAS